MRRATCRHGSPAVDASLVCACVCNARSAYEIKKLDCKDVISNNPGFQKVGLTKMMQTTWLLTKKTAKA